MSDLTRISAPSSGVMRRVVIERVTPQVNDGRFAIKRTVGERVRVEADIFADGHDVLSATLLYRHADQEQCAEAEMQLVENDRWRGTFTTEKLGRYFYTLRGWVDEFQTWTGDLLKRAAADQDISQDLLIGAEIVGAASGKEGPDSKKLAEAASRLRTFTVRDREAAIKFVQDPDLLRAVNRHRDRDRDTTYDRELVAVVDRERARFSTWYEMFPRSCTNDPKKPGTLRDCVQRLEYIAGMGFDVLYLPPIHPIGRTERKGKNNSTPPEPEDPGSPWAIGSSEGGHKAIHPQLGTLEDFRELERRAGEAGIEVAIDLAFQCSPDHPYVKEHREWFRERPDGSVQYAENPPKKYQDIYPFDFENTRAMELWQELKSVVLYWIEQGVLIFRVDNPHTKPFAFWEWLISEVKGAHPEAIFLSEAFTRPKVMYQLAKVGFTQSYTYFAWKNEKWELAEYFKELSDPEVREFFRPNLWPNTPDILNEYCQNGGRPAFVTRLILAATLGASYGIYGPAFELCESRAVRAGSEEYLDSEKYQVRVWDTENSNSLKDLITSVNAIRRRNVALQHNDSLRFHSVSNEKLIAYSKVSEDETNKLLMIVNLDPHNVQSGFIDVALDAFQLGSEESYQVHDLLTDAHYVWHGSRNYVELNPFVLPAHIFHVRPIG